MAKAVAGSFQAISKAGLQRTALLFATAGVVITLHSFVETTLAGFPTCTADPKLTGEKVKGLIVVTSLP